MTTTSGSATKAVTKPKMRKAASEAAASSQPPWDLPNPKSKAATKGGAGEATHHLTPAEKASAKRSAKKAGRPYPNLVDNMRVAAKGKAK